MNQQINPALKRETPRVAVPPPPVRQKQPKCPLCGSQPCSMGVATTGFGAERYAIVFFCNDCEAILTVSPIAPPAPETQPSQSRLITIPGA